MGNQTSIMSRLNINVSQRPVIALPLITEQSSAQSQQHNSVLQPCLWLKEDGNCIATMLRPPDWAERFIMLIAASRSQSQVCLCGLCDDSQAEGGWTYFSFSLISQAGVKPSAPVKTDLSAAPQDDIAAPAKTDTEQGFDERKRSRPGGLGGG